MFRRPRFRPVKRIPINEQPPALVKANRLMSLGNFSEAALVFEELAHGATMRNIPQDVQLFLAAAHCRIQARQIEPAMTDLKKGLEILIIRRRFIRFQEACQRNIDELKSAGFLSEAQEIAKMRDSMGEIFPHELHDEATVPTTKLPSTCTSCGGILRSDEVDRIDDYSVECPWCGITIHCD